MSTAPLLAHLIVILEVQEHIGVKSLHFHKILPTPLKYVKASHTLDVISRAYVLSFIESSQ